MKITAPVRTTQTSGHLKSLSAFNIKGKKTCKCKRELIFSPEVNLNVAAFLNEHCLLIKKNTPGMKKEHFLNL